MPIDKPYHRIWRPFLNFKGYIVDMFEADKKGDNLKYLDSDTYADQAESYALVDAAHRILQDLNQLFYYVEPCDDNCNMYSHRIYELFLRTATEFEANCKAILQANLYNKKGNINITDYYKINKATKLSGYKISFTRWQGEKMWMPFDDWNKEVIDDKGKIIIPPLSWYQAYNKVKHNRQQKFSEANLGNLMNAVAGLICILHAQMGDRVGNVDINEASNSQFIVDTNTFHLEAPEFPEDEQYSFVWKDIEKTSGAVLNYPF